MNDLRIKLPVLLLPVLIGTSRPFSGGEVKKILYLFAFSVLAGTLITNAILISPLKTDFRSSSMFISHIRFSLMMVYSIFILFYYGIVQEKRTMPRMLHITWIVWLLASLVLIRSLTGMFVLYATVLIFTVVYFKRLSFLMRAGILSVMLIIPVYLAAESYRAWKTFYTRVIPATLPEKTESGRSYYHNTSSAEYENGNAVWTFYCEEELRQEWNKRSGLAFDSLDVNHNYVHGTLVRYLASKGLTKDSAGMSKLTSRDIDNIKNGFANYIYVEKKGLYPRMYEVIWELDNFKRTGNPTALSVAQRIVFVKTALEIIRENFWTGVGTGDVQKAFNEVYDRTGSPLDAKHRFRAHNQFLTLLLTFGIAGFLWILFVLFYVPYKEKKYNNFLFLSAFIIVMLSWFNEDTLETQAGVTFFLTFIILFLLGSRDEKEIPEQKN